MNSWLRWGIAGLSILLITRMVLAQYGDISDLKLNKPEDKEDVKSTPPPTGAVVLFDGKNLDAWIKTDGKSPPEWELKDGAAMQVKGGGKTDWDVKGALVRSSRMTTNISGTFNVPGVGAMEMAGTTIVSIDRAP